MEKRINSSSTTNIEGNIIMQVDNCDFPVFTEYREMSVNKTCNWKALTVGTRIVFAVTHYTIDSAYKPDSRVYQQDETRFIKMQGIHTSCTAGTRIFLPAITFNNGTTCNVNSWNYKLGQE